MAAGLLSLTKVKGGANLKGGKLKTAIQNKGLLSDLCSSGKDALSSPREGGVPFFHKIQKTMDRRTLHGSRVRRSNTL